MVEEATAIYLRSGRSNEGFLYLWTNGECVEDIMEDLKDMKGNSIAYLTIEHIKSTFLSESEIHYAFEKIVLEASTNNYFDMPHSTRMEM